MNLNYEIERYTELTGEDGTKVPIGRLEGYLDGYEKGIENALNLLKKYGFEAINKSIQNTMGDEIPLWMWIGMVNKVEKRLKCNHYCHSCKFNHTIEDENGLYTHTCKLE